MNNIFDYRVKDTKIPSYLLRTHSRPTFPLNSRYIFLSIRQGERKSRRGVFLITQIYTEPLPERGVRILRIRKAEWKSSGTRTWPFCPLPPSVDRCNLPVFLAPLHPRTKCYPCSLTLISQMQYNREHNLEIARIIPTTGLIKACICSVHILVPSVSELRQSTISFCTENKNYRY